MQSTRKLAVIGVLLLAVGCVSTPRTDDPGWRRRNRLVFDYRDASTALRQGRFAEARALLDDAIATLDAPPIVSPEAKNAMFRPENENVFLGEPYEQVMAYYYRAMIHWMEGNLSAARADYRKGQILDADTERKLYASDFVLLDYLDGLITAKLGGDGAEALKRAESHTAVKPLPPYDPAANVVFFVELGHGPIKYAGGQYGELLYFHPGQTIATSVEVTIAGQTIQCLPYDDLFYQATTRGGRPIDHILAGKAVFKSGSAAFGTAALISGGILAAVGSGQRNSVDEVGAGLLVAGVVSHLLSSGTRPEADTRMWSNLPQYLSFAALRLPEGQHAGTVEFLNASRQRLPQLRKSVRVNVYPNRDTVVLVSDQGQ